MDTQTLNFLNVIRCAVNDEINISLENPSFERLYAIAKEQSLIPVFYEGLCKMRTAGAEIEIPPAIENRFKLEAMMVISAQAQNTESFLEIYSKLLAGGIKPIVMKGIICRGTYGELADHRPSGDEDIYIRREDFGRCREILEENGFEMEDIPVDDETLSSIQEVSFYGRNGLYLEVHTNPMGRANEAYSRMNKLFENAFDTMIVDETFGQPIYTYNHTTHFLFLFFHLYRHIVEGGVGLRQVTDIMMYNRAHGNEIDAARVKEVIKDFSAEKIFSDIIYIGSEYLGFSIKPIPKPTCPERLIEDMIESGIFGHSDRVHSISANMTSAAVDGGSGPLKSLVSALFPPLKRISIAYPILLKYPWLLPAVWVRRWLIVIPRNIKRGGGLGFEAISIGKKRIDLLKKYDII